MVNVGKLLMLQNSLSFTSWACYSWYPIIYNMFDNTFPNGGWDFWTITQYQPPILHDRHAMHQGGPAKFSELLRRKEGLDKN